MTDKNDNTFPSVIANQVKEFHLSLMSLKKELEPIINNLYKIRDDVEKSKDPIKSAILELTICQTINSLFYMYLQTIGVDVRNHSIGHELFRVEKYTDRLKIIKDKQLRPKFNRTVKAFVRNALFDPQSKYDDWVDNESKNEATTSKEIVKDEDDPEQPTKKLKTN